MWIQTFTQQLWKSYGSFRSHRPITRYISKQLRNLFALLIDTNGLLHMHIIPSTPQTNAVDCGVYAAANAVELAVNGKQAALQAPFCVDDMRAHLVEMLECGTATTFPRGNKRSIGRRRKHIQVTVDADGKVDVVM